MWQWATLHPILFFWMFTGTLVVCGIAIETITVNCFKR